LSARTARAHAASLKLEKQRALNLEWLPPIGDEAEEEVEALKDYVSSRDTLLTKRPASARAERSSADSVMAYTPGWEEDEDGTGVVAASPARSTSHTSTSSSLPHPSPHSPEELKRRMPTPTIPLISL